MRLSCLWVSPVAVIILSIIALSSISAQEYQSIAVLDFEGRGISASEVGSLTDRLRSELVKTARVRVVERGQMQQILAEQDFQLAGCTSSECAVEIGQFLGVTTMVAGSIGRVGSTYSIDIRTIDVQTSAIVQSITRDYRGRIDGLLAEMVRVAWALVGAEIPASVAEELARLAEQREIVPDREPAEGQPLAVTPKKRGRVFIWAAVGVLVTGGGYYAYTLLSNQLAADEGVDLGEPPGLPQPP